MKASIVSTAVKCVVASLLALGLSACGGDKEVPKSDVLTQKFDQVTKIDGKTFGTFYYVTVPGGYPGGEETLRADAEFVFKKVSDAISTFDPKAEIARFNEFKSTDSFIITSYLADVIEEVVMQSRRVEQAMDPTVGPLVNLWGFGPKGEVSRSPSEEDIKNTLEYVGLERFGLYRAGDEGAFLKKTDPRVELDLSTIGEGLAADELAVLMDQKGVENYMIAVAGAIRTKGANPDGKLWRVGIEDPLSQGSKVFAVACPQSMAISTAGSYRNFFLDKDTDKFYSHIIDTKTGKPISHRTVSVSVIDRSALITDAVDTGLLVLGAKKAVEWGEKNSVAVYAIEIDKDGKPVATYSRAFEPYLKCVVDPNIMPSMPKP
ncbi:FAD:protein FMN transferase [Anaerobiospirillum succiniciproducens]|uniref:FAD:protein FMN transferase n=1 Tax=Anaerobiospirillum succiniciproducens TaxID=13335 RepID=UPI00248E0B00|nr:FAD:protein FMN transferase [Anaerobiospirillum succiniciproducens]